MQSIILVGFMGAGKTTVGVELAKRSNCLLCDLDSEIIAMAGMSIPQIFQVWGETHFRDLETAALRRIDRLKQQVIATGGGVVERPENWSLLKDLGQTVYLQVSWDTLKARLSGGVGRPLASAQNGWEKVETLFLRREPLYRQADYVVKAEGIDVGQVAEAISCLFSRGKG